MELYGGGYSSEWFFSKVLETLEEAPEVYAAADRFLEAGDWLVGQLVGRESRSECAAGYKGMWIKGKGWPSADFFKALHPGLENVIADKVESPLIPVGGKAGELTEEMAELTGLDTGTPVAASVIDAHSAGPACSLSQGGRLAMIMGTSLCHMLLGDCKQIVEGCGGLVQDGIIPGFWGYEAGQAAVGDIYGWFFDNGLTAKIERQAEEAGMSPQDLLTQKASALRAGESGLLALDWWNGSRSDLARKFHRELGNGPFRRSKWKCLKNRGKAENGRFERGGGACWELDRPRWRAHSPAVREPPRKSRPKPAYRPSSEKSGLMDAGLSGVIVGMTLTTLPEEIYRAIVESTAFGTRQVIETFEQQGVPIRDIVACGGLAEKSPFVMQIFADVAGREILLPRSFQASGLGAAIHGAVAARCYPDFPSAIAAMAGLQETRYRPDPDAGAVYAKLFTEYVALHNYFGRGANDVRNV